MDNIDLIPKKPKEEPVWQEVLFYLSFAVLVFSLLIFLFLTRAMKVNKLEIEKIEQELTREKTQEEISLEKEVLSSEKKISTFSLLIDQQKRLSKVFDLFEKFVHPQVFFSKLSFTAKDNKVLLEGRADNFQALGQQSLLFKAEPLIRESNLEQASIGKDGGIDFNFGIILDNQFFKQ
jgi:hypothetical protein